MSFTSFQLITLAFCHLTSLQEEGYSTLDILRERNHIRITLLQYIVIIIFYD